MLALHVVIEGSIYGARHALQRHFAQCNEVSAAEEVGQ